jgi:hypothetical protein
MQSERIGVLTIFLPCLVPFMLLWSKVELPNEVDGIYAAMVKSGATK